MKNVSNNFYNLYFRLLLKIILLKNNQQDSNIFELLKRIHGKKKKESNWQETSGNNMAVAPGNKAERLRRKDVTVIIQCLQQSTRFRPGRKLVIPARESCHHCVLIISSLIGKWTHLALSPTSVSEEARMTMMRIIGHFWYAREIDNVSRSRWFVFFNQQNRRTSVRSSLKMGRTFKFCIFYIKWAKQG